MSAELAAHEGAPEVYRRWLRVDQPKGWSGPSESLVEQLWTEKSDEQKAFWRSLDELAAAAAQLAEVRAVLEVFDWETDDRQYALEKIDVIANRGRS